MQSSQCKGATYIIRIRRTPRTQSGQRAALHRPQDRSRQEEIFAQRSPSRTHQRTGHSAVGSVEDYEEHLQSFIDEYRPQGATESHLVQVLADTAWRQIRVTSLEADLLMFSPTTFEDFGSQAKEKSEPGFVFTEERAPKISSAKAAPLRASAPANAAAEPSEVNRSAVTSIPALC